MVGLKWRMWTKPGKGRLLALLVLTSVPLTGLAEEDAPTASADVREAQLQSFAQRLVTLLRREQRALTRADQTVRTRTEASPEHPNGPSPPPAEVTILDEAVALLETYEARRDDLISPPIDGTAVEVSIAVARSLGSGSIQLLPHVDSVSIEPLPLNSLIVTLGTVDNRRWTLVATDQHYGFVRSDALESMF